MDADPNRTVVPPSQIELDAALAQFCADWGVVDDVLYRLCRDFPGHDLRAPVTAKLALIGRAYAAGLERQVRPPGGRQAIVVVADFVLRRGAEPDAIIGGLGDISEPLNTQAMATIVEQHGRLTELLQERATDGKAPRSFASKYLHFHHPVIPIYDEYARQAIGPLLSP